MIKEQFVSAIELAVRDSSIENTEAMLTQRQKGQPNKEVDSLALWYSTLTGEDRANVLNVVRMSIDHTVFGFLCVLDGVRAIEGPGEKGELHLIYKKGHVSNRLNDTRGEFLHDIFSPS